MFERVLVVCIGNVCRSPVAEADGLEVAGHSVREVPRDIAMVVAIGLGAWLGPSMGIVSAKIQVFLVFAKSYSDSHCVHGATGFSRVR